MGLIWMVVSSTAWLFNFVYVFSMMFRPRGTKAGRAVLKPFMVWLFQPIVIVDTIYNTITTDGVLMHLWMSISALCQIWWWFVMKNDDVDDDWWKKKRKKALSKIKQVAGKLVVVPTPSPSPA